MAQWRPSFRCTFCGIHADGLKVSPPITNSHGGIFFTPQCSTRYEEATSQDRLSYLQKRLDTLEKAIENLQITRTYLEQEKERLNGARTISPICSMPPELLSDIFAIYSEDWWEDMVRWELRGGLLDDHKGWDSEERPRREVPERHLSDWTLRPMRILSQVCRNWRAVTRGCPSLWANIYISPNFNVKAARGLLSDQLQLSANQPLRIHTSFLLSSMSDTQRNRFRSLFRLIRSTSQRWTSINTKITGSPHALFLRPEITESPKYPSLVSLSILVFSYLELSYTISDTDAPLLREASLTWSEGDNVSIELPWAQLRRLHLSACDGDRALSIMRQLYDIEELSLHGIHEYNDIASLTPTLQTRLPSLHCLKVHSVGFGDRTAGDLLPHLQLPALNAVDWTQMNARDKDHLDTLLRQSSPGGQRILSHLRISTPHRTLYSKREGGQIPPLGELIHTLKWHLESLEVEYTSQSGADFNEVVKVMVYPHEDWSFPYLRYLKFEGVVFGSWSVNLLIEKVKRYGRNLDMRLLGCAFSPQEAYDSTFAFNILTCLHISPPRKSVHIELDIEGPHLKHLVYDPESGARIEERCNCRSRTIDV